MNKIITLTLNGSLQADLEWKQEKEKADEMIDKGHQIFWDLNLGLFSSLKLPLANGTQFLSLKLSVQHFVEKIWDHYKDNSVGVCLYKRSCDFNSGFPWDDQQDQNLQGWLEDHFESVSSFNQETDLNISSFSEIDHTMLDKNHVTQNIRCLYCRDAIAEYLGMLGGVLPEYIPAYILLDAEAVTDPMQRALCLTKDRFIQFNVSTKLDPNDFITNDVSVAVLLPSMEEVIPSRFIRLNKALVELEKKTIPYRTIPISLLISEWHGLDHLIVDPELVDSEGYRRLQGFCAAGGTVVSIGETMNMPYEESFDSWLS